MVGNAVTGTSLVYEINKLHERANAAYRLRVCNGGSCTFKATAITPDPARAHFFFQPDGSAALGPFDMGASNKVRLSADLRTLVVGAPAAVNTTLPRRTPAIDDDSAVYVFVRSDTSAAWQQQARLQASNLRAPACNNQAQDYCQSSSFGEQLALAADGNTLAAGRSGGGTPGAVHVFTRSGAHGNAQAHMQAKATAAEPRNGDFVEALGLSGDGNTLAAVGMDRGPHQPSYLLNFFTRNNGAWSQ